MKQSSEMLRAILDRAPAPTGRDGAMDFAAREAPSADDVDRLCQALGVAVVSLWSDLPQPIQEKLFAHAVGGGDDGGHVAQLREQLAKFLHDHHRRTAG